MAAINDTAEPVAGATATTQLAESGAPELTTMANLATTVSAGLALPTNPDWLRSASAQGIAGAFVWAAIIITCHQVCWLVTCSDHSGLVVIVGCFVFLERSFGQNIVDSY